MYIDHISIRTTEVYGFWQDHTDISIGLNKVDESDGFFLVIKELLRLGLISCSTCLEKKKVNFETNSSGSYFDFCLSREADKAKVVKILIDSFEFVLGHKITFPNSPDYEKRYTESLNKVTDFFKEALAIMKEDKYHYYYQGLDGWN